MAGILYGGVGKWDFAWVKYIVKGYLLDILKTDIQVLKEILFNFW